MRSLWPYLRCMYTATLKKIGDTKDLGRLAVMIACWIVRCRLSVCEFCFFYYVVEWHHQQSILAFLEPSPWLFPSKKSLLDRCHYQRMYDLISSRTIGAAVSTIRFRSVLASYALSVYHVSWRTFVPGSGYWTTPDKFYHDQPPLPWQRNLRQNCL